MNIKFYLDKQEVQPAIFKKFSFQCDTWVKLLADYERRVLKTGGALQLTYHPGDNTVSAIYDHKNSVAHVLHEQVEEIIAENWNYIAPAGKLVALN